MTTTSDFPKCLTSDEASSRGKRKVIAPLSEEEKSLAYEVMRWNHTVHGDHLVGEFGFSILVDRIIGAINDHRVKFNSELDEWK